MYTSRYIKNDNKIKVAETVSMTFFVLFFIMPQYFGVQIAGFDLTSQRAALLLILFYILEDRKRSKNFVEIIGKSKITPFIMVYLFVLSYTMVLRADFTSLIGPLLEFVYLFIMMYIIKEVFGVRKFVKTIRIMLLVLCLMGPIEFVTHTPIFSYLETIPGLYTGQFIRSGSYRIMGPFNVALGYGLMLIACTPLVCFDLETYEVDIFADIPLLLLMLVNVFLMGSRSTLGIFILEIVLLFAFSSGYKKRATIVYATIVFAALALFTVATYNTGIGQYIMRQLTSMIDEIFGTQLGLLYGADITRLSNSSNYRKLLLKVFEIPWLNPLVGRGAGSYFMTQIDGVTIISIDNFYVQQYIKYAYPGMFSYILILLVTLKRMLFDVKSGISKIVFVGVFCYALNLYYLDSLQTLKYLYILFAIFYVIYDEKSNTTNSSELVLNEE